MVPLLSSLTEGFQKRRGKVWSFTIPPSDPSIVFVPEKNYPPFVLSEIRPLMGETNFTLVPYPKFYFLFFDTGLLFYWIRVTQATFKAVLMDVYMI